MVRDAEMPTREFLELVLRNIDAETDIGVVQRILGQLAAAIVAYGDPSNLDAARERFASFALSTAGVGRAGERLPAGVGAGVRVGGRRATRTWAWSAGC